MFNLQRTVTVTVTVEGGLQEYVVECCMEESERWMVKGIEKLKVALLKILSVCGVESSCAHVRDKSDIEG